MKRVRYIKHTEEYAIVPDDFELNSLQHLQSEFLEIQSTVSILLGVEVISVDQFEELESTPETIENGEITKEQNE